MVSDLQVLTYVSRGFEEYRVSHKRCKPLLRCNNDDPTCTLIVGSDLVAYGSGRRDQRTWGEWA